MGKGRKRPASALLSSEVTGSTHERKSTIEDGDDAAPSGGSVDSESVNPSKKSNEIRFGKYLASSDKNVRDRTVVSLREWLHKRSVGGVLSDLDLLKVSCSWYCC